MSLEFEREHCKDLWIQVAEREEAGGVGQERGVAFK